MSLFSSLPDIPPDQPFAVESAFQADSHPQKCNLGLGVYRSAEGYPWPLPTVTSVEKSLVQKSDSGRHEYIGIAGDRVFVTEAQNLLFGFATPNDNQRLRVSSVQTISGTGANHAGATFLSKHLKPRNVWLSDPTWGNHFTIWEAAGVNFRVYPYYDGFANIAFERMKRTLESEGEPGDIVVLHACAHNPTGMDLSKEQWKIVAEICVRKKLFPFFDCAYQGFASGDVVEDAWAIQFFFNYTPSLDFCVAQSFSKSFGLYGQRVGAFHLIEKNQKVRQSSNCLPQMCQIIRAEFSMAPRAGSDIVKVILGSPGLRQDWQMDLEIMSKRLQSMRKALFCELTRLQTPGTWDHITAQIGMFSYTGLSSEKVLALRERHHVYALPSGRISISGPLPMIMNDQNVKFVAAAIDDVVRNA